MPLTITRVLKAPTKPIEDLATLQHLLPLYASDKEDGIRCIIHPTMGPLSQQFKPIPNDFTRTTLAEYCPPCLDGELTLDDTTFNDVQSAIMTQKGTPDWKFRVFDSFYNLYAGYQFRMEWAIRQIDELNDAYPSPTPAISFMQQTLCETIDDIKRCEDDALHRGKEGLMLRTPLGLYKEGRSTFEQAYLLKVKRFMDDEAVVIGIEEQLKNCNPAIKDHGGLQRRGRVAAFMKPACMVGRLVCRWRGKEIKIGSGLTEMQKLKWWTYPHEIIGRTITFKYQPHGMLTLPRAPIFKGIRYD
jgi:DNA ligase-1